MHESHLDRPETDIEPPISVSRLVRIVSAYKHVIAIVMLAIALLYTIIAVSIYVLAPSQRISMQQFRLDFEGAGEGKYPNASRFSVTDIVSGPILSRAYRENHLEDYLSFGDFSHSVYVLESNPAYQALAADYQARLSDTRITPIDRERLQQEFDLKKQSIAKNEYAIYFTRRVGRTQVPEPVARKVLLDVLKDWADFAVNQQHVIAYEVSVLSPEILTPSSVEQNDLVIAIAVLRSKVNRVLANIDRIEKLPGARLVRTASDHLSLEETRLRLDDILRFRLEPLLSIVVHSPQATASRTVTIRFLESQLAYDERKLESTQRLADASREALMVYEQPTLPEAATSELSRPTGANEPQKSGDAIMPQLNDTFLERLMSLTSRASDSKYRQNLVDSYRIAVGETIPLSQAVAYDKLVLNEVKKPVDPGAPIQPASARAQIEQARAEIGQMINRMNELFQIVSRNMTPSTQMMTLTGPPTSATLRGANVQRLALYGLLVLLISLPLVIIVCLIHNRVREEESSNSARPEPEMATAGRLV